MAWRHVPCQKHAPIQEYARVRARESKVSREMVANCSRPLRLLQLMLMPVQIATRAIAPHAVTQFEHSQWDEPPP
jgi:hypothetical protein